MTSPVTLEAEVRRYPAIRTIPDGHNALGALGTTQNAGTSGHEIE